MINDAARAILGFGNEDLSTVAALGLAGCSTISRGDPSAANSAH